LLDMMVRGLERLPTTRLANPPRMADFAHWAVACGLEDFEAAYAANRQNAINVILSHDPIAKEVRKLLAKRKTWTGTMEDFLDIAGPTTGIKSTKKLSDELRRLAPMLRSVGVRVVYEQRIAERRPIRIERI
jgi:putative DNA primase/helicase